MSAANRHAHNFYPASIAHCTFREVIVVRPRGRAPAVCGSEFSSDRYILPQRPECPRPTAPAARRLSAWLGRRFGSSHGEAERWATNRSAFGFQARPSVIVKAHARRWKRPHIRGHPAHLLLARTDQRPRSCARFARTPTTTRSGVLRRARNADGCDHGTDLPQCGHTPSHTRSTDARRGSEGIPQTYSAKLLLTPRAPVAGVGIEPVQVNRPDKNAASRSQDIGKVDEIATDFSQSR